jgi:hypothetical protein
MIDARPGDVHMGVPGFVSSVEGYGSRLIRQPEHSLDAVCGMFPLLPL